MMENRKSSAFLAAARLIKGSVEISSRCNSNMRTKTVVKEIDCPKAKSNSLSLIDI